MKTTRELMIFRIPSLALLVAAAFGVVVSPLAAAELMVNGNVESFSGGVPTGWTYYQGDGAASLMSSVHSPFQNVYAGSTSSVLLIDGNTSAGGPELYQSVTPTAGIVHFSMEFATAALTGNPWEVEVASTSGLNVFNLRINNSGLTLLDGSPSYLITFGLTSGTWYQLGMDFNYNTGTYSGYLQPYGQAALTINNRSFFVIPGTGWSQNFGRVLVYDAVGYDNEVSPPMYIDNISARPIPEPGVLSLCGVAILSAIRFRRR
jgi:hypothetical protein